MSAASGLPVTSLRPQTPSRSSRTWKAVPRRRPARPKRSPRASSAPAVSAPRWRAAPNNAPDFFSIISRYSSRLTCALSSNSRSRHWPSIMARQASSRMRQARTTAAGSRPASASRRRTRRARVARLSPALMAWPAPHTAHTVGRWRRSRSPSWMSSCTREKLWVSSRAAAAARHFRRSPPRASQAQRQRLGRRALPPAASVGWPWASSQPRW